MVAVKIPLIANIPPVKVIGPAMVVDPPIVISAVLVDLPMIRLDKALPKFQPDVLNALVKLSKID